MNNRMLRWVGAGVLATGLSSVMFVGVGIAAAAPDAGAGGGGATSSQSADGASAGAGADKPSQSSNSTDTESNSMHDKADDHAATDGQEADGQDATDEDATEEHATTEEEAVEEEATDETTQPEANDEAVGTDDHDSTKGTPDASATKGQERGGAMRAGDKESTETNTAGTEVDETEAKETEAEGTPQPVAASLAVDSEAAMAIAAEDEIPATLDTESPPAMARFVMSAVEEEEPAPAPAPSLINIVGSFFFNVFQAFEQAVAGAPQVPPGSTVHVQRSQLSIDCGPGYTVDADWYFPDTEEPPTRLIYFQHGFPGSSAEYDYTAAELAERNQAIVVAPTISSNLFDCYACQLGGDPMHAAVAKLFLGDRADLLASAKAAGFDGDALPERFVIAGHSGGGQLAGGAAGYFEEFAKDEEDHNLVGVLLLDTSPIGGAIERGVGKIPDDIPVYTIGGAPGFLNSQGGVELVLEKLRPNEFVGVELVNGTHGDAFQSHNLIVQIGGWIAGLGIPRPENIEAVQTLTQGWIDDWYDGTDTGVYGALGSTVDIPDTDGARAYVLPAPAHQWTIVDLIVEFGLQSVTFVNVFATCAEDPSAAAASTPCSAVPAPVLTTSLSRELEN